MLTFIGDDVDKRSKSREKNIQKLINGAEVRLEQSGETPKYETVDIVIGGLEQKKTIKRGSTSNRLKYKRYNHLINDFLKD